MFMRAVVVTDDMDIEVLLQTGISAYSLSVSVHRNGSADVLWDRLSSK